MDVKNNWVEQNPKEVHLAKIKLSRSILTDVLNTTNQFKALSDESDTRDS